MKVHVNVNTSNAVWGDVVVGYADGTGIVTKKRCGRLGMP